MMRSERKRSREPEPATDLLWTIDVSVRMLRSISLIMSVALAAPLTPAAAVELYFAPVQKPSEPVTADSVAGENAERATVEDKAGVPFSISVDGQPLVGADSSADRQRQADIALERVDIQVKF